MCALFITQIGIYTIGGPFQCEIQRLLRFVSIYASVDSISYLSKRTQDLGLTYVAQKPRHAHRCYNNINPASKEYPEQNKTLKFHPSNLENSAMYRI